MRGQLALALGREPEAGEHASYVTAVVAVVEERDVEVGREGLEKAPERSHSARVSAGPETATPTNTWARAASERR